MAVLVVFSAVMTFVAPAAPRESLSKSYQARAMMVRSGAIL